jgi:hypothetical protein
MLRPCLSILRVARLLLVGAFALSLFSSGCGWAQYPDRDEAVAGPFEMASGPGGDSDDDDRKLFVLPDGLWAYLGPAPDGLEAGDLALAGSGGRGSGSMHLFGVVSRHGWGIRLQRLDAAPFDGAKGGTYRLRPVGDATRIEQYPIGSLRVCLVRPGEVADASCVTDAPAGTRWDLYPITKDGSLPVERVPGAMPVPRAGLLHRGGDASPIQPIGTHRRGAARWVAVARPTASRPPPDVSVTVDADCRSSFDGGEGFGLRVDEADVPSRDHPLYVEETAYRLATDALLDCDEGTASARVPTLFRPVLSTVRGTTIGPAALGRRAIPLESANEAYRRRVSAALAYLAAGDPVIADYALERAARTGSGIDNDRLMVGGMQVAAAAGRPEAAHRRGHEAGTAAWNRDNNPGFLLGRAAAHAASGKQREYFSTRESAREAADRRDAPRLEAWLEWADTMRRATGGELDGDKLARLADDFEGPKPSLWRAAIRLISVRRDVAATGLSLRPLPPKRKDIPEIRAALEGGEVARSCSGPDTCRLDGYGRRLAGLITSSGIADEQKLVDRILRMGRLEFQPGVEASLAGDAAGRHLSLPHLAALATHLGASESSRFDNLLTTRLVERLADTRTCEASGSDLLRRQIALEAAAGPDATGRLRLLDWWYNGRGAVACRNAPEAAASLVALSSENESVRRFLTPLFPVLVDRAESNEDRRAVVERAAEFTRKQGRAGLCKRWRLALAAGAAASGNHREASSQIEAAVSCGADEKHDRTESLVIAYTGFLRSAAFPRKTNTELLPTLDRMVRRRVEDACVGLAAPQHRFTEALPDEIARLAGKLTSPRAESGGMLTISSSRDRLRAGLDRLEEAKRAAREGDFETAEKRLADAGENFRDLTHAPGLAQVKFLESVVSRPDEGADSEADSEKTDSGESQANDERDESAADQITECPLDDETQVPDSRGMLRCLLRNHSAETLADRWSERTGSDLSTAARRHLGAILLLADRRDALRAVGETAGEADEPSVCSYPEELERIE